MKENIIEKKSFDFAIEIVATYKYLTFEQREFTLSKQLLRSGTSIGANIAEAIGGQSSKDFIHKLKISRKETNETLYWLKLLEATNYLKVELATNMIKSCMELLKILTAIIKTMEAKLT
jgi:four helix bundle protein